MGGSVPRSRCRAVSRRGTSCSGWHGPATDDDVRAVVGAVDRVNEVAEKWWLDLDDQPTIGRTVVRVGRDLVWEIATQHPDGPVGWLEAIAGHLTGLGWSGRIETSTMPDPGPLNELPTGEKVTPSLIAIAWAGCGHYGPIGGAALAPWRADETVVPLWSISRSTCSPATGRAATSPSTA